MPKLHRWRLAHLQVAKAVYPARLHRQFAHVEQKVNRAAWIPVLHQRSKQAWQPSGKPVGATRSVGRHRAVPNVQVHHSLFRRPPDFWIDHTKAPKAPCPDHYPDVPSSRARRMPSEETALRSSEPIQRSHRIQADAHLFRARIVFSSSFPWIQ
ncbi:hypothetical protein D3C76_890890 [compost metagenome]